MTAKILGSFCILAACGAMGYYIAFSQKKDAACLRTILSVLQYMESELKFHQLPLPLLCVGAAKEADGIVSEFFRQLGSQLREQTCPNVQECVSQSMESISQIPERSRQVLLLLGQSMGRFDLEGQLKGLASVQEYCRRELSALENGQQQRLRGYQTLGLCAGAALVILFI